MKKIVVDTDILIDHAHGYAEWIGLLLKQEETYQLIVPTIVAAEYLSAQDVETKRAVYLNAELATRNRAHFKGIPDLRFFNPEKSKMSS